MENSLNLGMQVSGQPAQIPLNALKKHIVVLGASGSGKTVMGKVVIEEAALNHVPSVIIDPQGDLASLGIAGTKEELEKHGVNPQVAGMFSDNVEVRVFTPASSRGIPLSINPLKLPASGVPEEEAIRGIDLSSACIAKFMGYDIDSDDGRAAQRFIYQLLHLFWKKGEPIEGFNHLASFIEDPTKLGIFDSSTIIADRGRTGLARKMRQLTIGANQLMFNFGVPIDLDVLLRPSAPGKTPINVIYLNVLTSDEQKQFFVGMIAQEIYNWMLQNPSEKPQLIFYIDEIAPYMPPYPLNPPAKEAIVMLFKQGRKYGVSCLMATQNFADVDYKALGQAGTWLIGRFMAKQDMEKLKPTLRGIVPHGADAVIRKLPALQPGEFILLSPDNFENVVQVKARWLFTRHKTLDDESVADAMSLDVRNYFGRFAARKPATRLAAKTHFPYPPPAFQYGTKEAPKEARDMEPYVPGTKLQKQDAAQAPAPHPAHAQAVASIPSSLQPYHTGERHIKPADLVYVAKLTCPQQEALKIAKSKLSGTLFSKDEEIADVSFKYVPLWQVKCAVKRGVPLISRRTEAESVYINALNGALCTVEKSVKFSNLVDKRITGVKDLDGRAQFEEADRSDVEFVKPKIGEAKARRTVHRIFGKEIIESNQVLLPVWTFAVKSKYAKKGRTIIIDGVIGKEVEGGAF